MAKRKSKGKPALSPRDKGALRRIMKTVRKIKVWNATHGK